MKLCVERQNMVTCDDIVGTLRSVFSSHHLDVIDKVPIPVTTSLVTHKQSENVPIYANHGGSRCGTFGKGMVCPASNSGLKNVVTVKTVARGT